MYEKKMKIPDGVEVTIEDYKVTAKGPKGENSRDFDDPRFNTLIKISNENGEIVVKAEDRKKYRAMVGTTMAHIRNMMLGAEKGYKYVVRVNYSHFPVTVEQKGDIIVIKNFLGAKGLRTAKVLENVKTDIQKDEIIITGSDKEAVSQTAANLEMCTRITGKDRRVFGDGCFISGTSFGDE